MNFDGAVKNFLGSARHVDAVIIPPFDKKISALDVDRHFTLSSTREHTGNADCRGAGAASPGLASPPFPHSHPYFVGAQYFDKFRVHSLRKKRMMLEAGPDFFQIQGINVIQIEHAMGVAHGDTRDLISCAVNRQWMIDDLAIGIHGNLSPFQYRLSHVHFDQFTDDLWANDACQSFDFQLALFRKVVVVNIFGKTANAVAAHFHLATVGVIDLHLEVGDL